MNTSKLEIIICSTSIANYDRRMQRIAMSMQDEGHKVEWISRSDKRSDVDGINHVALNPIFGSGFLFYAFFNLRLFVRLLFKKYNLIYSVDLDTVLACYLVSKIRRKAIVFDAHEYFTEVPELINRPSVKKLWEKIANFCLPNIKYNITVGQELSKIFTERYNQSYEVIGNIGTMAADEDKLPKEKNKMVYLGVVNEGRGIELAIKALQEFPDKELKIIGEGDLSEEMKKLAKSLGVEDRVEFMGYVLPLEIGEALKDCYLALNMLLPKSKSYYYSLANKFFDYIHVGIPTINMNFPEYEAIHKIHKTGLLVDFYELSDLISAIKKMDDISYYNECLKGIEAAKSVFNWETEQKKLIKYLDKIKSSFN